jgi:hypothetical protein
VQRDAPRPGTHIAFDASKRAGVNSNDGSDLNQVECLGNSAMPYNVVIVSVTTIASAFT